MVSSLGEILVAGSRVKAQHPWPRAIAGVTYPLVNKSYTPDAAASLVTDGLGANGTRYLPHFPYLGTPVGGYQTKPLRAA